MCERLDGGEDNDVEGARKRFDNDMGVAVWRMPGEGEKYDTRDIPAGAPSWWFGDEEASQSFLLGQGVIL